MQTASALPAGWEWDYDGTRWFYTFKANGHVQYHFPSEGDEFPDFVGVTEPAPGLEPEGRLESHQQVRRVTGAAPVVDRKKKNRGNGMTATARPVGIEWDGDVGGGDGSSGDEDGGGRVVFEPENLMFLGPQVYAEVSPLVEEEEEAAKRTVVGSVVARAADGVSPADTTSAGTPAAKRAEPVTEDTRESEPAAHVIVAEVVLAEPVHEVGQETARVREELAAGSEVKQVEGPAQSPPAPQQSISAAELPSSLAQPDAVPVIQAAAPPTQPDPSHEAAAPPQPHEPTHTMAPETTARYELAAPDPPPFNPVGVIAEMPTEDTPRSHIELNPIPVEIMDASVLAPIETAPPLGVAELPGQSAAAAAAVVRQTTQTQQSNAAAVPPVMLRMKIKRKPTDPNAVIPSPLSASSSSAPVLSPSAVSPPSVASPEPASAPVPAPTPPPAAPRYKPYAPVSPLLRADTEPVGTVSAAAQQQQQRPQSVIAPPSPIANPQLNYAPTVLRPAGRQSMSVSPERRPDGGSQVPVATGMPEGATRQNASANGVPARPLGSLPQQGAMPVQTLSQEQVPLGHIPPQGQLQQGQVSSPGPTTQQGQYPQNAMRPPMPDGRPMSMFPGQYPPVPIPRPYSQYQQQSIQQPAPPWLTPGQQLPGQSHTIPLQQQQQQQQQPAPGWLRQSMPPGYPSAQQPPNGRHSMMAYSTPGTVPLGNQYQPASSATPPPNQQPANPGRHRSSTDSSMVSPLRPRADSQPETPQAPPAAQHTGPSPPPRPPKLENSRIGTGANGGGPAAGQRKPTAGSYFPPSKAHPVGLVGDIANQFAAEMQAALGPGSPPSSAAPTANTTAVSPEPKTLVGAPSPGPGSVLGRIEEHEAAAPSASASAKQEAGTSSAASRPAQPSLQPTTQPEAPVTSQQEFVKNTPQAPRQPQQLPAPTSGQRGAPAQGAQEGVPSAGQGAPPGPMKPQGPVPPQQQGIVPQQQQWQGKMQQPVPRPPSVPPQMQMQPNKSKENKWTKWFKSSKPEKKPDGPQGGMPQRQPPPGWGQPQQWQPGAPMPGHPAQRLSVQGQPMQGLTHGHPVQGQPIQGQPIQGQQGQTMQRPYMGGPIPPQNRSMNAYPPHQMPSQQGPLGSHPPQQYMAPQPGQPVQTRPPYGAPVQQMQPPGAPGSPAPSQMVPSHHSYSPSQTSISSLAQTGHVQSQPQGQVMSPMPAPLSVRPRSEIPAGVLPGTGQPS